MNALLLAAASAGAIAVFLTTDPSQAAQAQTPAQSNVQPVMKTETVQPTKLAFNLSEAPLAVAPKAKSPAAKAQPTAAAPKAKTEDKGSMRRITEVDPQTGEETKIDIIAFNDG